MIISFQQWREADGDLAATATAPATAPAINAPIDARAGLRDMSRMATSMNAPAMYAVIDIMKELAIKDPSSFGIVINAINNGLNRLGKSEEEAARLHDILRKAKIAFST